MLKTWQWVTAGALILAAAGGWFVYEQVDDDYPPLGPACIEPHC